MATYDETLAGTTSGRIDFGTLLRALAIDVEQTAGTPTGTHAPTDGRVAEDTTTGTVYIGDGSQWHDADTRSGLNIPRVDSVKIVSGPSDLPDASGGVRTLEDNTAYYFTGFVMDTAELRLGDPSPLLAPHGAVGGYIHTDGGTALKSDGEPFFARNVFVSAPGGTVFDLTADNTTEMLVESCAFSDAAGFGNLASLGTIDGYRVPSFKGCNFEDFDDGLTFDGDPDKIFISESPFRGVTASNVDIFHIVATCDVDIVDCTDSYVKGVQADTSVWRLETIPNEILQYRGTTHDTSVTKSNVITGSAATNGRDTVGVRVTQAFPLEDSSVAGDLELDSAVAIPSAGSTTQIVAGNTQGGSISTTLAQDKKVSKPTDGKIQYDARDDRTARVFLLLSLSASNTTVSAFIGKNDNHIERSQSLVETSGSGSFVTVPLTVNVPLTAGDTVSAYVRDDDGTADIEIEAMSMTLGPE
jgi:hypothetical protein